LLAFYFQLWGSVFELGNLFGDLVCCGFPKIRVKTSSGSYSFSDESFSDETSCLGLWEDSDIFFGFGPRTSVFWNDMLGISSSESDEEASNGF
jgi:hypothetical protein